MGGINKGSGMGISSKGFGGGANGMNQVPGIGGGIGGTSGGTGGTMGGMNKDSKMSGSMGGTSKGFGGGAGGMNQVPGTGSGMGGTFGGTGGGRGGINNGSGIGSSSKGFGVQPGSMGGGPGLAMKGGPMGSSKSPAFAPTSIKGSTGSMQPGGQGFVAPGMLPASKEVPSFGTPKSKFWSVGSKLNPMPKGGSSFRDSKSFGEAPMSKRRTENSPSGGVGKGPSLAPERQSFGQVSMKRSVDDAQQESSGMNGTSKGAGMTSVMGESSKGAGGEIGGINKDSEMKNGILGGSRGVGSMSKGPGMASTAKGITESMQSGGVGGGPGLAMKSGRTSKSKSPAFALSSIKGATDSKQSGGQGFAPEMPAASKGVPSFGTSKSKFGDGGPKLNPMPKEGLSFGSPKSFGEAPINKGRAERSPSQGFGKGPGLASQRQSFEQISMKRSVDGEQAGQGLQSSPGMPLSKDSMVKDFGLAGNSNQMFGTESTIAGVGGMSQGFGTEGSMDDMNKDFRMGDAVGDSSKRMVSKRGGMNRIPEMVGTKKSSGMGSRMGGVSKGVGGTSKSFGVDSGMGKGGGMDSMYESSRPKSTFFDDKARPRLQEFGHVSMNMEPTENKQPGGVAMQSAYYGQVSEPGLGLSSSEKTILQKEDSLPSFGGTPIKTSIDRKELRSMDPFGARGSVRNSPLKGSNRFPSKGISVAQEGFPDRGESEYLKAGFVFGPDKNRS